MLRIGVTWSLKGWQRTVSRLGKKLWRLGCTCCHTPVIPTCGEWRQEDQEFRAIFSHISKLKASPGYTWACLKKQKTNNKHKKEDSTEPHCFMVSVISWPDCFSFSDPADLNSIVSAFLSQKRSMCEEMKVVYSRMWPLVCVALVHLQL